MRAFFGLGILLPLAACAMLADGPNEAELGALIARFRNAETPTVRNIRCRELHDPTERRCAYQEEARDGRWVAAVTYLAIDGEAWILIDGVMDPNR